MEKELKSIAEKIKREIDLSGSERDLEVVYKKYLEKRGELSVMFQRIKDLLPEEKVKAGLGINKLKKTIIEIIERRRDEVQQNKNKEVKSWFDTTLPGKIPEIGHLHPITQSINKAREVFAGMGFSIVDGPELEDEWHNFDALNFPQDHPAREMQDTLFIKQTNRESLPARKRFLMRTHTSPVQIRYMMDNNPPFRIIAPGRVFRNEATDVTHEVNFYQIEGLMIDKNISVANFKAVVEKFFQSFYQEKVKIRLRPSFFPFTEPSFEVDMKCFKCNEKGCSVCSQSGWLEMMGAGMVHPNVLKNSGVNPRKWQGFAFGIGWDRIVMMQYKIDDIRLFYGGDLRFLRQF